jgi:FixJ family two-component response regulator
MTIPVIIICDDETELVSELAEWFESNGWVVRTAHNANEAFVLLADAKRATCLVTDLWMPLSDGDALVRRIGALPVTERPSLVAMMTGDIGVEDSPRPPGTDLVFMKPVDPTAMLKAIADQLSTMSASMS